MTPNEFKAWFDGFTEAFEGRIPTKAQWGRIKDRVAEIDGKPVTERIYVDRYLPYYWSGYSNPVRTFTNPLGGFTTSNNITSLPQNMPQAAFCSSQAMNDLGRAEAKSLAA